VLTRLSPSVGRHKNEHGECRTGKAVSSVVRYLCVAVCATVLSNGWCRGEETKPPKTPSLSEIVFVGLWPAKELDPSHYPKERRVCLQNYLTAIGSDSYLWTFEPPSLPQRVALVRRVVMREQMVAILVRQIRAEAEAFTDVVPVMPEWEGVSEGPVGV
jgi:hypothetical protein